MRESGEPMECGIFDFYKVFSRAFGEGEEGGCRQRPRIRNPQASALMLWDLEFLSFIWPIY